MNFSNHISFIWSVAELLRGHFKQFEYGKVILPFTLLRRLDCVLADTKQAVLKEHAAKKSMGDAMGPFLCRASGHSFFNVSPMDMGKMLGDPDNIRDNLIAYVESFSPNVRDIFMPPTQEKEHFLAVLERLDKSNLLFLVAEKFASIGLHPDKVGNHQMGLMFEELIRKFSELSNETAGEHFTPREVIKLMVNILFAADDEALSKKGIVRSVYDPTAGTGGMLSTAGEHLAQMNPHASLAMFGQEMNPESYSICKSDMLIKGQDDGNIAWGNTLADPKGDGKEGDQHAGKQFDYMLSNPPFGVSWEKYAKPIQREHKEMGFAGRFGPGIPRISDGSFLFLMHLISKMRPKEQGGSRIGIVFNGSPLFTGGAGSGESEIRKWIIENDWLESIVALPEDMFYNTGISTYVWVLSNNKRAERKGKIQLIDGSMCFRKMRKGLGKKNKELGEWDIDALTKSYCSFVESKIAIVSDAQGREIEKIILDQDASDPAAPDGGSVDIRPFSKIFRNEAFGYSTIAIERPLRLSFMVRQESIDGLDEIEQGKKGAASEDIAACRKILESFGIGATWTTKKETMEALEKKAQSLGLLLDDWREKTLMSLIAFRDPNGEVQKGAKGRIEPDSELRDFEHIPLSEDIDAFFNKEVLPHVPDAWVDHAKTKVGYEIPFNRHFYVFKPPRPLHEIDEELGGLVKEIAALLGEMDA